MTEQTDQSVNQTEIQKRTYWAGVGLRAREGMKLHELTGQLEKGPESWRNVTEHCLVQVARSETLGKLLGLPEDLMQDMRIGAMLHDFDKKQEMTVIREANKRGDSPLFADRKEHLRADILLEANDYGERVIRLASASGIDAPQLVEAQSILDKKSLSDEDLAWLVVHYVDDCSIGTDWVQRSREGRNVVDDRMDGNKAKPDYVKISQEISQELVGHPKLGNMNLYDAGALVSHQIEQRFAQRIQERTGEVVDPLALPELVDQKIKENMEIGELKRIGIAALLSAKKRHDELGRRGLERVQKNQFGETALRGDVECEKEVINEFERNKTKTPIVIYSEEHGRTEIGNNPQYLAVLDGIDGTALYKKQFGKGGYATLLGIFEGTDPNYEDALFGGIMAHATGELFYAVKGQGAFVFNLNDRTTQQLPRIDEAPKDDLKWKKLYASTDLDSYLGITLVGDMVPKFPDFDIQGDIPSAVAYYIGLLTGERAGILDGTRKDNLEMAAVYRLIRELGGVVVTTDGEEIGDQKYLTFGQGENHIPIIIASSRELARRLSGRVLEA